MLSLEVSQTGVSWTISLDGLGGRVFAKSNRKGQGGQ